MAGPIFRAVGSIAATASGASLAPTKPTVDAGNGILVAVVCSKNNAAHGTATGGWSRAGTQINSGASFSMSVWIAAESAGAPTFTWTGAVAGSAQIAYYSDPQNTTNIGTSQSSNNNGLTATHSTAALTTDANDALAVYLDACAVNTAGATPTGWIEDLDNGSATSATHHLFGSKAVASSGSSSGAISITAGSAAWVQFQIQLKGDTPTAGLQVSKEEVGAWLDVPAGLSVSKEEVGAWLDVGTITPDTTTRRRQLINC